jgi:hypothetical protein
MSSRENRDQIPTESNREQTREIAQRQGEVSGESREKPVKDFPKAAALGQALKEMRFPADKQSIVRHIEQSTNQESREILPFVQGLEDRSYDNVSDIAEAAKLVG